MRRHIRPDTTVGNAHGTIAIARAAPCPTKPLLSTNAMPSPKPNSSATLATVKITVLRKAPQKIGSENSVT
jgi:hypothetical protein